MSDDLHHPDRGEARSRGFDQASLRAHVRARAERIEPRRRLFALNIPNSAPTLVAAAFLATPFVAGLGWGDVAAHLAAGFGVLLVGYVGFMLTGGGLPAGLLKLMAGLAVWLGPGGQLLWFALATALIGGGFAVVVALIMRRKDIDVPMAPAAALAFALTLPSTPIWPALAAALPRLT